MSWSITITVIVVIVTAVFAYSKYIELQKDIHELALVQQSNITSSRKPNETAIYRNTLVPFEMPLVTGLSIRQGFKLRNGNLRDIWSVVFDQKPKRNERIVLIDDKTGINGKTLSLELLNGGIKTLNNFFKEKESSTIGITSNLCSEYGVFTALTCFTNSLTLHHFQDLPSNKSEVDLLIIYESQWDQISLIKFKHLVIISEDEHKRFDHATNWFEISSQFQEDSSFDYKYDPAYDQGIPLISDIEGRTNEFTHQNFVSSIASIVKTIPLGHEFGLSDSLLVTNSNDLNSLTKVLAILLFGGSVILNNTDNSNLTSLVEAHRPTIICTSTPVIANIILSKYANYNSSSTLRKLKFLRAEHLFSEGVFTRGASDKLFSSLRLIYVVSNTKDSISSRDLNFLRILTGSRVIAERFISNALGPVLSTNFYDYRILSNGSLVNRGAPSLSLELKNFQSGKLNIEKKHGELCIRGFIIGKPHYSKDLEDAIKKGDAIGSEGWMPTGIIGRFGNDGCFYEDK